MAVSLIRLKQEDFRPARDVIVAFTADEEAGGDANGVKRLLEAHRDLIDADLVMNPDGGEAGMKSGRKLYVAVPTRQYFARRAELEQGQLQADMRAIGLGSADQAAIDRLSAVVETNIMLRTTCTATMIDGGHAENALPQRARATLQCRGHSRRVVGIGRSGAAGRHCRQTCNDQRYYATHAQPGIGASAGYAPRSRRCCARHLAQCHCSA